MVTLKTAGSKIVQEVSLGYFDDERIKNRSGSIIGYFDGNRAKNRSGSIIGYVDDGRVKNKSGSIIGYYNSVRKIEVALFFFYFFY